MKLQITCQSSGYIIVEIMLAFSLFVIFIISTLYLNLSMHSLKIWSLKELDMMASSTYDIDNRINLTKIAYGNDTYILSNDMFSIYQSDYVNSWGRDNCSARINLNVNKISYYNVGVSMGEQNPSTDLKVRNDYIYLSTDSSISSLPDFYIINTKDYSNPYIVSSLNTGPGISAIDIAGPYVFMAQASTVNLLQILDIHDRNHPTLITQLKLPTPTPTTTAPFANSIFYSNGYIYLGTAKWSGPEFYIIDVSNIQSPTIIGSFETNTLINDIYVIGNTVYLASSDERQLRVLDISNKGNPVLINSLSPSGWQTQEGKIIDYFENNIGFGRTVGGFNVLTNHELFLISSTTNQISKDIPTGVYGILQRPPNIFILTRQTNKELQVFDSTLNNKLYEFSLESQPVKMVCDNTNLFFATGDNRGFSILKIDQ